METGSRAKRKDIADGDPDTQAEATPERGDDGISWDKVNKCYVGTISLGYGEDGKRLGDTYAARPRPKSRTSSTSCTRRSAGIETPATYTVRQCVADWLDSLERDPHTMATYRGQAEKWIYPKIGRTKLKDFKAADADRFFRDVAKVLSKASLVKIKSTLVRSIRRAQKYDLIGRNVAELVDLPQGQPGHPSRAMTEEQAGKVLEAAGGQPTSFVKVVKVGQAKCAATHAATEANELACGTWTRQGALVTEIGTDLRDGAPRRVQVPHASWLASVAAWVAAHLAWPTLTTFTKLEGWPPPPRGPCRPALRSWRVTGGPARPAAGRRARLPGR